MRKLSRGSKIFNSFLSIPLVAFGLFSVYLEEWKGALACFALALFLFWIWPTITGNIKASLVEKTVEVTSRVAESKRANHLSAANSQAVNQEPAVSSLVESQHEAQSELVDGRSANAKASDSATPSQIATLVPIVSEQEKSRKRIILGAGAAVVALLVVSPVITNSVRSAWDRHLQRNYARGEAEYLAQLEEEERATLQTSERSQAPADQDAPSADDLTPNGHARWVQLPDIIAMAPEDGSAVRAMLTWTAAGGDSGSFLFEVRPDQLGSGDDPSSILDGQLFDGELGSCYVDDSPVSFQEFCDCITARSETLGAIEFTSDGITGSYAYLEGYEPAGGY